MADTTTARLTEYHGPLPAMGTFPVAANTYLVKGALVDVDGSGNAVVGGTGTRTVGKAAYTVDNRTGSEFGGTAGDVQIDVEYGVFSYVCADALSTGAALYTVDNQTVSTDDDSGARPFCGIYTDKRNGQARVFISPLTTAV